MQSKPDGSQTCLSWMLCMMRKRAASREPRAEMLQARSKNLSLQLIDPPRTSASRTVTSVAQSHRARRWHDSSQFNVVVWCAYVLVYPIMYMRVASRSQRPCTFTRTTCVRVQHLNICITPERVLASWCYVYLFLLRSAVNNYERTPWTVHERVILLHVVPL